jgi:hypothetical protein
VSGPETQEAMPIESWTAQEDTPDLAAHATAMIDAALVGTDLSRDAYWAAVRKGYNTPYNDPPRRRAEPAVVAMPELVVEVVLAAEPLPVAALAAVAAEARAA